MWYTSGCRELSLLQKVSPTQALKYLEYYYDPHKVEGPLLCPPLSTAPASSSSLSPPVSSGLVLLGTRQHLRRESAVWTNNAHYFRKFQFTLNENPPPWFTFHISSMQQPCKYLKRTRVSPFAKQNIISCFPLVMITSPD